VWGLGFWIQGFVQCLWELEVLLNGEMEGHAGQTPERGLVSRWYICVLCSMLVLSSFPSSCVCGLLAS
jgi:hypothetical protein